MSSVMCCLVCGIEVQVVEINGHISVRIRLDELCPWFEIFSGHKPFLFQIPSVVNGKTLPEEFGPTVTDILERHAQTAEPS